MAEGLDGRQKSQVVLKVKRETMWSSLNRATVRVEGRDILGVQSMRITDHQMWGQGKEMSVTLSQVS